MNITFFWLNLGCPVGINVGVGVLSGELKEAGHRVQVLHLSEALDYPYDEARIGSDIESFGTDLFALSFGGYHIQLAERLVSFLHARYPDLPVVCGGIQATLSPEPIISWPGVDYVCRGEADSGRFVRFVAALQAGEDVSNAESFWVKQGATVHRNPIGPLPDLAGSGRLDLDAYDLGRIIELNRGFAETLAGRGCPKQCTYCHNHAVMSLYRGEMANGFRPKEYLRHRRIDDLMAELREFVERFPQLRAFNFGDDALVSDRAWFAEFAARYPNEVGRPFVSNATVDQIDEERAALLAQAGCNMIKFGIECGSERVRNEILNKHISAKRLVRAVQRLHAVDINIRGYIMIGNPTETPDEMIESFRLCATLGLDTTRTAVLYPYPGTEIHRLCVERDLLREDVTFPSNLTDSVLKWDAETELFIHKCLALHHWIMNSYLDNEAAAEYAALWERAVSMPDELWRSPDTGTWIRAESERLSARLRSSGAPHYCHPFPERPDVAYLIRQRRNRIVNVDDPASTADRAGAGGDDDPLPRSSARGS